MYFNYPYSLSWLVVTAGGYGATAFWGGSWFRGVVAGLALWRVTEILVGQVKMLLDRTHRLILAAERNLVFLAIDALAATSALAVRRRARSRVSTPTTRISTAAPAW